MKQTFINFFKSKWLKWSAITLVGLVLVTAISIYAISEIRINRVYQVQPAAVSIPQEAASITEGQRLYHLRGCVDCHGQDGAGSVFIDDPALGRVAATNLTPAASRVGGKFTDVDWVRAIRHGLGNDGKPLLIVPSQEFNSINDTDLGALIAYIKSLPPVEKELPANKLEPLARILFVAGVIPLLPAEAIDHDAKRPVAIAPGVTVEYGAYLAQTCSGCHGAGLSGGPMPGVPAEPPYPANLTPNIETGLGHWTEVDFTRAMREGRRLDNSEIDPSKMPWPALGRMTDTELSALWLYLQSVPPQSYGNR